MNMSASEWSGSSGCESGWTSYLDQSSVPRNDQYQDFGDDCNNVARVGEEEEEEEEEEDLSMVSDASSGPPPHYCEDDDKYNCFDQLAKKSSYKNKKKVKEEQGGRNIQQQQQQQQFSFLDDTATSSPVLGKKVVRIQESSMDHDQEFSQGSSATHFKGKSGLKKQHFGFFQSSIAEKSASKEPRGFQGRKWK